MVMLLKRPPGPPDRLYVSGGMRELIIKRYGNMTYYIAVAKGRELKKETRCHDDMYELELGPVLPVIQARRA